jgi:signal transduction histidine kinase
MVLRLLNALFEEEGLSVELAGSAAEAKAHLERPGSHFDLVLSDIQMPGETGFDLLQWIKKPGSPFAHLPVLLTTAELPQVEHRLKGLSMGAVDYVVRPIELKELVIRSVHAIDSYKRIRSLETSLQDTESLAMVGRILAASNHEIKNLVTLVKLSTDQLDRSMNSGTGNAEAIKQTFDSLKEASNLLSDVARNMAQLINPQARDDRRPWMIKTLVDAVAGLMAARVRPFRIAVVPPPGPDVCVMVQGVHIKQVLINLILNAQEAIHQYDPNGGGKIVISWKAGEAQRALLSVTDNGIGLSHAGEKNVFQPFESTKSLRGGQGLGLWLCSKFIENMGGALTLSSHGVGKGATATMALPITSPQEEMALDIDSYLIRDDYHE